MLDALKHVISLAKPGTVIYDLCLKGDAYINDALTKIYTKKKFIKGIAFPTTINVNEVCGHFSALNEDSNDPHEYKVLSDGDLVKIDLGVQINGFAALVAHTIVVGEGQVTGRKADVILAAYNAIQSALRSMYPQKNNNNEVTGIIKTVCDSYKVTPVEGVLSHRMKRDIVDGMEVIINHATFDQKVDQRNFEFGDVFGLDVIVSSAEGKPRETTIKTSIYKRALETTYKLKTESGRKLLSVIEQNFHTFPFSLNSFDNEDALKMKNPIQNLKTTAKMGLVECVKNELVHPYPVLSEKKGEFVAQFKYTIAVLNEGPWLIAGNFLDLTRFNSEYKVTNENILKLLEVSLVI
jgi:curved DNA binding protein